MAGDVIINFARQFSIFPPKFPNLLIPTCRLMVPLRCFAWARPMISQWANVLCVTTNRLSKCFVVNRHFYSPAQLVRGFILSYVIKVSRGHRCLPVSPPIRVFVFIAHRGHSAFPFFSAICSSIRIESRQLTLWRFEPVNK